MQGKEGVGVDRLGRCALCVGEEGERVDHCWAGTMGVCIDCERRASCIITTSMCWTREPTGYFGPDHESFSPSPRLSVSPGEGTTGLHHLYS